MSRKRVAARPSKPSTGQSAATATTQRLDSVGEVTASAAAHELGETENRQEVESALVPLRGLLEEGEEEGARQLVDRLLEQWPDSPRLQHLARVLAPPTVRVRTDLKPVDRSRERAWLRAHAHEYPGCWIAVLGDQLVAADRELDVVLRKMKESPALHAAILYFAGRYPE
jgi:hypothetical protein